MTRQEALEWAAACERAAAAATEQAMMLKGRVDYAVKLLTHALRPLNQQERQVLEVLAPGKKEGDFT